MAAHGVQEASSCVLAVWGLTLPDGIPFLAQWHCSVLAQSLSIVTEASTELTPQPIKLKCFSKHFIIGQVFVKQLTLDSNWLWEVHTCLVFQRSCATNLAHSSTQISTLTIFFSLSKKWDLAHGKVLRNFDFNLCIFGWPLWRGTSSPLKTFFKNRVCGWNWPTRVRQWAHN